MFIDPIFVFHPQYEDLIRVTDYKVFINIITASNLPIFISVVDIFLSLRINKLSGKRNSYHQSVLIHKTRLTLLKIK